MIDRVLLHDRVRHGHEPDPPRRPTRRRLAAVAHVIPRHQHVGRVLNHDPVPARLRHRKPLDRKTTLTEKLLLYAGAIELAGAVRGRNARRHATSDWMELEQQRGISITSAALEFELQGRRRPNRAKRLRRRPTARVRTRRIHVVDVQRRRRGSVGTRQKRERVDGGSDARDQQTSDRTPAWPYSHASDGHAAMGAPRCISRCAPSPVFGAGVNEVRHQSRHQCSRIPRLDRPVHAPKEQGRTKQP